MTPVEICAYVRDRYVHAYGDRSVSLVLCIFPSTVGTGRGDGDGVSSANKLQSVDENEESRILHYTLTIYKLISYEKRWEKTIPFYDMLSE
jgi:hypothetical protein